VVEKAEPTPVRISASAKAAAMTLLRELDLQYGEVTIRAVQGRPRSIRWTNNWEDGKSEVEEGR
jgi:hypothetical protein